MAQANAYGSITIVDMTDIERIYVEYCRSTSNQLNTSVTPPVVPNITVNWSENTPPWVDGQYIWQRSVVKKSGSNDLSYGTPVCLTGAKGGTGATGQSLTGTKTQYTNAASDVTITVNNHTSYTWTDSTPEYDTTKPTYWGRITNTYTNPAKTEYLFYKDQALTDAIYNAYVANSIATHAQEDAEGALSQANSNINEVVRLWQAKSVHSTPNLPPTEVTTGSVSTYNSWSTVKPTATDTYRYFYYCDQSKTGGGICTWSEVIEDTSYLSTYEINALNVRTKNFFKGKDATYDGWFASGRKEDEGLNVTDAETYLYNARFAATNIALGYNKTPVINLDGSNGTINIYRLPTIDANTKKVTKAGALGMQLGASSLNFYEPPVGNANPTIAATLSSTGLNIVDGSIILGGHGATGINNGDIALSNSNFTRTINEISRADLRFAIGSKFGVKNDGTLYASNAIISGAITATSLSTGTKTSETTGKGIFINSSGAIYSGDGNVNNFIINEYGAITAKSGTIGGWTIDSNSIHSDTKTAWDEDKNGIYMGRYSEGNNTIFAIAGGKIQYIESEDNSVQEDTIYYEKIKQLTNDETQDGAKDYYIKNGSEYIIVEQEDRRSYFLTSDITVKNKLYYTKNGDNYVVVDNPTGNPSAKGYYEMTLKNPKTSNWYEEIYQVVISPTGDPKQKGYYESAGPMWYIKSDGSASFGSLIVNRYGKLDVPAANITGMLTADQIEVSNLSAISTNIGSSVGQESTTNTLDVDTQIDYVLTNDERVNPNKTYYSLSLVDEEEGYVEVSNPSGNPKEQPYYEKINNSLIKLKTQKIFYKLTEDTTVVDGTDYYEFNTTPILTSDVEVNKSKDYYTVTVNSDGSFVSTLVIPNDTDNPRENKWYELNSSYDLINLQEVTGTINPKNKYWYIIDNICSAEMSLLNAELNINANDKELLSIDSKVDSDEKIEVTNMSLSGGLSIGELILAPFDGGIAILV